MNHIKHYIKMHNWHMVFRMIFLYIKLWWPVWCDCPIGIGEKSHRVQVMYWPRTAYHWEGKGQDPNGPMLCCYDMEDESKQYWDDMWSEYYSSVR